MEKTRTSQPTGTLAYFRQCVPALLVSVGLHAALLCYPLPTRHHLGLPFKPSRLEVSLVSVANATRTAVTATEPIGRPGTELPPTSNNSPSSAPYDTPHGISTSPLPEEKAPSSSPAPDDALSECADSSGEVLFSIQIDSGGNILSLEGKGTNASSACIQRLIREIRESRIKPSPHGQNSPQTIQIVVDLGPPEQLLPQ